MPTEQRVRLDDVQGLPPELGASSRQNQADTFGLGQLRSFDLTIEDNELLPQHSVFDDEIDTTAGDV